MFDISGRGKRKAHVKKLAEDMAVNLIGNGLQTSDPDLLPVCEKLRPFQESLVKVDRNLVRMGLNMFSPPLSSQDDHTEAKACLVELVKKLEGMAPMLGIRL